MSGYLYILGNTPLLAFSELQSFLPEAVLVAENVAVASPSINIDRLGGTVKIAEIVAKLESISAENLAPFLKSPETFGLSFYSPNKIEHLEPKIKEIINARYVKSKNVLSSVTIAKKKVTELILVKKDHEWLVGKTIAVQDFKEWARRDRSRPYADPKSGMLPLKVARMAVNISNIKYQISNRKTLLDPFCGMGTILGEALLTGWRVYGSDQSTEVVEKAKRNVPDADIFVCDATHVSEKLAPDSIDAIVTEPFMGSTKIGDKQKVISDKLEEIKNSIRGLEKLYIGCLKDWKKVLKPQAKVVIALPEYAVGRETYFVKKVIDNCETYGYTVLTGPIAYYRPNAIVRRKFYVFQNF